MIIHPASSGGIALRRLDLSDDRPIPARVDFLSTNPAHSCTPVSMPARSTTVAIAAAADHLAPARAPSVATIEHLLSALAGLAVSDALVDVYGPEIPILDGSSRGFVEVIEAAGVRDLREHAEPIVLPREIVVRDERSGASIRATPRAHPGASFEYRLAFAPPVTMAPSLARWETTATAYAASVAWARTFCFDREAKAMQAMGLFRAFTTRDLLVLRDDGTPIDNELRSADEPARHKLLDLVGDLALLGAPLQADVVADRSGHALTHRLCAEVMAARGGT